MDNQTVSVVIPAYNEAETIGELIHKIRSLHPSFEILVIDDGSSDETSKIAFESGSTVYRHPYNIGNGAAIKSGIRFAIGDVLLFMDGDGQHDPAEISSLLSYFPEFDMVVGARQKGSQASIGRAIGNAIYNWLGSYVSKFPIPDLTSGFRAIKREIALEFLFLLPNTYSYPTTLTLGVLRTGRSVKFLPIKVHKRKKGESKIHFFRDGARFFMIITRICTFFSPMRVFLPVSLLSFVLGLINYGVTYFTQGRFTNMSALLFINAVLIFMMSLISEQISQMRFERRERRASVQKMAPESIKNRDGF